MVAPFNTANAFDLSHDHKLTCHMGHLVPVMCEEVCPGDVFRWNADVFLRLMPMLAPMMHDVDVYLHCFNVPSRIIFDGFESFITGGPEGTDSQTWPYIVAGESGFAVGSLADYLGLPTGVAGIEVSALPFRAYDLIYNEWYRDQNLIDPVTISKAAGLDSTTSLDLQRRAWHKDYFTGALPWAQRGQQAYLPLGTRAPLAGDSGICVGNNNLVGAQAAFETVDSNVDLMYAKVSGEWVRPTAHVKTTLKARAGGITNGHLYADLSTATAATINDIRVAFQIQRFMEKNARGGSRYIEWLLNHFGVRSSDARLRRPEYLGGGKCPISISEVLQTSSTDATSPQGNMAGRGISYQNVPQFTKTFEEFGYVICLLSIIPRASYQQGIRRMWTRKDRYDYPLPVFAHLGNQAVKNKEIFAQAPTVVDADGNVVNEKEFGYQERYEELRRIPSQVCGQFRTSLDFWHLGRKFANLPELNKTFVECAPSKRVFAVTDADKDECIVQIHHNLKAIRRFPSKGSPGLIDHD